MDIVTMAAGALAGVAFGWFFTERQHVLYSEAEFRAAPASGRRLLFLRLFCMAFAGASLALALRPDFYDAGPALLAAGFILVLVAVSSTDFDRRRIPNKVTYPAFVAAIALCWAWPDRSVADIALGTGVGLLAAALLVGAGIVFGGGGFGLGIGDGKLMLLMGAILGWPGILPALLYGVMAAGFVAVVLMFRVGRKATFSYGPYLAGGAVVVLLFPALR